MKATKKSSQEGDIAFPSPPSDGVSSICCNGYNNANTNLAVVTAWDNTVSNFLVYHIHSDNKHSSMNTGQLLRASNKTEWRVHVQSGTLQH